ncbi:Uma2 family endonuclease [Terracidiphilus sp.]|uniref:Uma2 family endonuclease n=1 Tax=Terracidiphilus sp. TaxID=1964191 RepID=UPI003C1DEB2F
MATQPVHERFVPVEEYLSTVYEPDCEYDNGIVVERNLGEFEHAYLQTLLAALFTNNMDVWGVFGIVEQRVQINARRFLVPDVCVLRVGDPTPSILTQPPLLAIELLSPEDTLRRAGKKAEEYLAFGVQYVWVIDPNARVAYRGTENGLERIPNGELAVPGAAIVVRIAELFEKLDHIRGKRA